MILMHDFFKVVKLEQQDFTLQADLEINKLHRIFEGHFPGQPVVPGVCMMQMVKEIIEIVIDKKTNLTSAGQIKFLAIINPGKDNLLHATIQCKIEEGGHIAASATLFKEELIHFKFRGVFSPTPS